MLQDQPQNTRFIVWLEGDFITTLEATKRQITAFLSRVPYERAGQSTDPENSARPLPGARNLLSRARNLPGCMHRFSSCTSILGDI